MNKKPIYIAVFMILSAVSLSIFSAGERYTKEGHDITRLIVQKLINNKICENPSECIKKLGIYGGHGDRVNLSFYGIADRDLISQISGIVIKEGVSVSNGAPIKLVFFSKHRDDIGLFERSTPFISLEVK